LTVDKSLTNAFLSNLVLTAVWHHSLTLMNSVNKTDAAVSRAGFAFLGLSLSSV